MYVCIYIYIYVYIYICIYIYMCIYIYITITYSFLHSFIPYVHHMYISSGCRETPSLMFGKKTEQDLSQSQDTEAGHFDSSDIHSFDALEGISV